MLSCKIRKNSLFTLLFLYVILFSCENANFNSTNNTDDSAKIEKEEVFLVDRDSALKIADENARTVYMDLTIYSIRAELKDEKWMVDYDLSDPEMNGGGPHYMISARTGKILSFRYEQ